MSISFLNFAAAAVARTCAGGNERVGFGRVPGVGAGRGKQLHDLPVHRGIEQRLAALLAQEHGDGNAPDALAGDAPVGAGRDHVRDAVFAPGRVPFHFLDFVERTRAQRAARRSPMGVSIEMNHCSVARKMIGLWQRQQCG